MWFDFMFAFGLICAAIIVMVVKEKKSNKK